MPELLLELFSEEIPARMQVRGAEDLARLVGEVLGPLAPFDVHSYSGPRRIALAATVQQGVAESRSSERGPRVSAPEQALAGFLRKHAATRGDLRQGGEFWVLERAVPGVSASELIAREVPGLLRRFPWPKSMRWGGSSRFTWVRPLRRILCILDGAVVPFDLRDGEDDGHGLISGNETEGHRFLAPGAFAVASEAEWRHGLHERRVVVDVLDRRQAVWDGIVGKASERGLTVVPDSGLLDEVAGLVEWPVALMGRIEPAFMDLPPEVMQVSMRVNQRYFALRDADGQAAPWFAFAANIEADDGGAAIVAGNERVIRARFSDARHFWDLDRQRTLESRVEDLRTVTFHAKIGTQYDRAKRLEEIAGRIAELIGASVPQSQRAGLLCKADLTTGMVGEFPELQGVMGGYYADPTYSLVGGEDAAVRNAIRDHYQPRGPDNDAPTAPVTVAVALADKLDQLVMFFAAGEKPSGSGDPFALRRAAIGLVRLNTSVSVFQIVELHPLGDVTGDLVSFIRDRVKFALRSQGFRADVVAAFDEIQWDSLFDLSRRIQALQHYLSVERQTYLEAWRRPYGILCIENDRDGPHIGDVNDGIMVDGSERSLNYAVQTYGPAASNHLERRQYDSALQCLASLRSPIEEFFREVTVNHPDPSVRLNRLNLVAKTVRLLSSYADFSKIEG